VDAGAARRPLGRVRSVDLSARPEGQTAGEIAERICADRATVQDQLEQLEQLGYVELRPAEDAEQRRAWLTIKGYDLLDRTETALIASPTR
jgi:DNA-binding MarR family transcriptional regulator